VVDGSAQCVGNSCDELDCAATERCTPTENGALCVDISCSDSLDCAPEEFCDGVICLADLCLPGAQRCVDEGLERCNAEGSRWEPVAQCSGSGGFVSQCIDNNAGDAWCSCEGDWDCPAYMRCEVGQCKGTGVEPSCLLPSEPFANVLPVPEIVWGGEQGNRSAVVKVNVDGSLVELSTSPFPNSNQVVHTPLVANLDDDNGDGLINELDFPEIIFVTFCNSEYTSNGVLRAIHGGGPKKGLDFFASCGNTVWNESDDLGLSCSCANAIIDSTSSIAVGDLDGDGIPEIVAIAENDNLLIYDNTGHLLSTRTGNNFVGANPAAAIANVDNQGYAEIIVGRHIFTLERSSEGVLQTVDRFDGTVSNVVGRNGQGPASCVANLSGDERLELVTGSIVYRFPSPPPGVSRRDECAGPYGDVDHDAFCAGTLIEVWDGRTVNGSALSVRDGFCAIADVLGADRNLAPSPANPLDGQPEVILIAGGRLEILGGDDGVLYRNVVLMGAGGGAPNVDDFDGDGFPEVGTAGSTYYVMYDLQEPTAACPAWPNTMDDDEASPASNPARIANGSACLSDADCIANESVCNQSTGLCVCLHNGWRRATEDDSSRVTGSSVFDFNGDGAAEVVYNDECYFRIYDGLDGTVWFKEPSESRTRIEYPIVADVDNDGNAEIVFATSNESGFCSANQDTLYNNGIEVWGDQGDYWVSARRIWNQYSYHVTNVTEAGGIPLIEAPSWVEHQGRSYNTYRSNPRSFGVAPDLALGRVQLSSPDASCGQLSQLLNISVRVENLGDLRVGPGVSVEFIGEWSGLGITEPLLDQNAAPLRYVIQNSLEPRRAIFAQVSYDAANNSAGSLPDILHVRIDGDERERECDESNNAVSLLVSAGELQPDLRIALGEHSGNCPAPVLEATVFNDGSESASDIVVRFYLGDPAQGGTALLDTSIPGPLSAGAQYTFQTTLSGFPWLKVRVFAEVDPDNSIEECNDGDNVSELGHEINCYFN
jgi:hypothetical protein